MKAIYPVLFTPLTEGGYMAYVPDLDINTQGESLVEAIEMARDAIGIVGISLEDMGKPLPEPTQITKVKPVRADDIVTLVDINFSDYRRKNDMRTVRRNVSLPNYLNDMGERAGLNFSQILQDGLRQRLGVK